METRIALAHEVLRLAEDRHLGGKASTVGEVAGVKLAHLICDEDRLVGRPGPWTEGFDRMARRRATRRSVLDERTVLDDIAQKITNEKMLTEPAEAETPKETTRRLIYQESCGRLYRIEQTKETAWQTTLVSKVKSGAKTLEELQAELDRLAPIDPRD